MSLFFYQYALFISGLIINGHYTSTTGCRKIGSICLKIKQQTILTTNNWSRFISSIKSIIFTKNRLSVSIMVIQWGNSFSEYILMVLRSSKTESVVQKQLAGWLSFNLKGNLLMKISSFRLIKQLCKFFLNADLSWIKGIKSFPPR